MEYFFILLIRTLRFLGSIMILFVLFILTYSFISSLLYILIDYEFYKDVSKFIDLMIDIFSIDSIGSDFYIVLLKKAASLVLFIVSIIGMLIVLVQLTNMEFLDKIKYLFKSLTFRSIKNIVNKNNEEI